MTAGAPLPRALGGPVLEARMRASAEDFRVDELDAFPPSGDGEHLLLVIEKRGMNTGFVARRLAEWAGVPESAVGYAGMKDRHAVTRQRFSVQLPGRAAPDAATLECDGLRVLAQARHARKLPRGALAGNRFELVLRGVQGDPDAIDGRLQAIGARGVPNYFGQQRFGHGGGNIGEALAMFSGRRVRREQRGLLLSAARSELFNRVLATRVSSGTWDSALPGEAWILDGNRSVFGPEPFDAALAARLAAFDIHPSGPLWGRGELRSGDEARAVDRAVLDAPDAAALAAGLEQAGLRQERRALRVRPGDLSWERPEDGALRLRFTLPAGSYATAVVAELGAVVDAATRA